MANERWNSPFPHTIAFVLFKEHFTELNNVYWAHVPAASTIEKKALEALESEEADPKLYFLIPDKDDRRIAQTYGQWKSFYREFSNYTRLNMLMLLSSCFETYLRTIVSLSLESKPGIIIKAPDAVDGWFLFRKNSEYGNYGSKDYQFLEEINSVCQGDWNSRTNAYIKYFENMPLSAKEISELDDLRQKRNLVGHYFGREKQKYEAPLLFEPSPVLRISHDKLIKYFNTVYEAVVKIDKHLHRDYIGSYDVMKYFYIYSEKQDTIDSSAGDQAKELQKLLGGLGFLPAGAEYYRNIITYTLIENEDDTCRYNRNACIAAIRRRLRELNVSLQREGHQIAFSKYHFGLFSNAFAFRGNSEYCKKYVRGEKTEFFYSAKAIDLIVSQIQANPTTVISNLQNQRNKCTERFISQIPQGAFRSEAKR